MAGTIGRIPWGSDFVPPADGQTWGASSMGALLGNVGFCSVNEGATIAGTVDEPGGIIAFTNDTGDNDNGCLHGPVARPTDGEMWVEARWKIDNLDCAIFFGFTETLSLTTPVMPAEFATATMTYNGTGGMVGFNYDVDGTTDDYRAVMGDGGAGVAGSSTTGIRANATTTVDRWLTGRVELHPDGSADCYLADVGHLDGSSIPTLRLIKHFAATLTPTDLFTPILMCENRSANARVWEVDYIFGECGRDWSAS